MVSTTKRHFVCHDHSDDVVLIEIVFCFAAVFGRDDEASHESESDDVRLPLQGMQSQY